MHTTTRKAEREWTKAKSALEKARLALVEAQRAFEMAEDEERKARSDYKTYLELDGLSFEERQRQRDAFHAIVGAV